MDFKEAQYRLAGATPEDKSKLVKDILAFANAWKTTDAYILIGVRERKGLRAEVVGVTEHLEDAHLQQLVDLKTNESVAFHYVPTTVDGKAVGIIRIDKDQRRPIYLRQKFGTLEKEAVYLRRGSSTAIARPEEVARMGAAGSRLEPTLVIRLRELAGGSATDSLVLRSTILREDPPELVAEAERISELVVPRAIQDAVRGHERLMASFSFPAMAGRRPPRDEVRKYLREQALLRGVVLEIDNLGEILAEDVRVELHVPTHGGLLVRDEEPERPTAGLQVVSLHALATETPSDTWVDEDRGSVRVRMRMGKIQPGARVASDPFWIGSDGAREVHLAARVFGDNIPRAIETGLGITFEIGESSLEEAESAFDRGEDDDEDDS